MINSSIASWATSSLKVWNCGRFSINCTSPRIMAIINLTPDSFTGDGLNGDVELAKRKAEKALKEGAHILDIGGESTRPGSMAVSIQEEIARIVPTIKALVPLNVPISVDTFKPEVMEAAIEAGASIINDINALKAPGALEVIQKSDVGVCMMHMLGEPETMQIEPIYDDVVSEVESFLSNEVDRVIAAGIDRNRIVIDPGFGFGKSLAHNLALFRSLPRLCATDYPVLIGVSRKRMLGEIIGKPVGERIIATATASVIAAQKGATILRVHDVAATKDALAIWNAID